MDETGQFWRQMISRMVQGEQCIEASGGSIKMFLKKLADMPNAEAIIREMTPDEKKWVLDAIRSNQIRNKRHSRRLEELAQIIEDELM